MDRTTQNLPNTADWDFICKIIPKIRPVLIKWGNDEEFEGIMLDVLIKTAKAAQLAENPIGFLKVCVSNAIGDQMRRRMRAPQGLDELDFEADPKQLGLFEFLATLPSPYKEAAQFVWIEGGTLKAWCEAMGVGYKYARKILDVTAEVVKAYMEIK